MKRYTATRVFSKAMKDSDIGVFIGDSLCKEAFEYHRESNLYLSDVDNVISICLGIAMCTDKRIFIFCDDYYFLRNMSETLHVAVSRCKNIILVILVSGSYIDVGKQPTIIDSIMSLHGMLFNMGFMVHDYKRQFKNSKNPIKEIRATWERIRGPLAVVIPVDKYTKKIDKIYPAPKESLFNINKFLTNEDIEAYTYAPPVDLEEIINSEEIK